jgi:hypothetical protein
MYLFQCQMGRGVLCKGINNRHTFLHMDGNESYSLDLLLELYILLNYSMFYILVDTMSQTRRSQRPDDLMHERSSPPETVSRVRIPVKSWMFVRILWLCCPMCTYRPYVGLVSVYGLLPSVQKVRNWRKPVSVQQWAEKIEMHFFAF